MRRAPLLALLPMLAAPWAPALGDPPPGDEEIVALRINGQDTGATFLVRRDEGGALLIRAEDFAALRLKPPQEATIIVDGVAYFRLDAAMGADVRFDPATQRFTSVPLPDGNANVRQIHGRPGEVWGAASAQDRLVLIRTTPT